MGLRSYVFEIGRGIRLAVDNGAACVNISAGYPCGILTTIGPDFDICSSAGRLGICTLVSAAAHGAAGIACGVFPPACPFAVTGAAGATDACLSTLALGDLTSSMSSAASYAERRGVPVVASAGNRLNRDDLPEVIREVVDLDVTSLDQWRVIPAALPQVIAVGAVNQSDYRNVHFHGSLVDVWAPIRGAYYAPSSADDPASPIRRSTLGGTSAAAPFVTGVIAAMQAVDPTLDPNSALLTEAERAAIVPRIRSHLRSDEATLDDVELQALGFASDPLRERVIDPLGAVRAVTPLQAQLEDRSFDLGLGFDEVSMPDDSPSAARTLSAGTTLDGTLLDIFPGGPGGIDQPDEDWFELRVPGSVSGPSLATIEVRSLGAGRPFVLGAGIPLRSFGGGVERVSIYEAFLPVGVSSLPFALGGGRAAYKISATFEQPEPFVSLVRPFDGERRCIGNPIQFEATAAFVGFASEPVPASAVQWSFDGVPDGTGPTLSRSFVDEGPLVASVRLFDDPTLEDTITLQLDDCEGEPPSVEVLTPVPLPSVDPDITLWTTGSDAINPYVDVLLQASVSDPDQFIEDADIEWTTSEPGVQGGSDFLGTGRSFTARLYTDCVSTDHEILVRVVDDAGNVGIGRVVIRVNTLC
ncbi:MAG: S8 family serine peptidase [Myxococcota bacterium]